MIRRLLLLIVACGLLSACASDRPMDTWMEFDHAPPATPTREDCVALGGSWLPTGESGSERCHVPTKDAGKPCRDAGECESTCIAPRDAKYHARTTGRCHHGFVTVGMCAARVHEGRAGATVCED